MNGAETHDRTFQTTTSELEYPDQPDSRAVDESVFSTYVSSIRDERGFGAAGIWGIKGKRPVDTFPHLGALTETRRHDNDAVSDHALAVYDLEQRGPSGNRHQCWLWSGFDVSAAEGSLSEISIEFDAHSENVAVGVYAPWETVDSEESGRYSLDLALGIGQRGLATLLPLADGTINIDPERTAIGPGGSVRVHWSGREKERHAIGLTCETRWEDGGPWELSWTVSGTFS